MVKKASGGKAGEFVLGLAAVQFICSGDFRRFWAYDGL